jgi:hypothetical protein
MEILVRRLTEPSSSIFRQGIDMHQYDSCSLRVGKDTESAVGLRIPSQWQFRTNGQ